MKELIDFRAIWVWMVEKWRTSFVVVLALVIGYGAGNTVERKEITEDCKFMGVFRDGIQAYNCNPRAK